jgi:hypothetical protein
MGGTPAKRRALEVGARSFLRLSQFARLTEAHAGRPSQYPKRSVFFMTAQSLANDLKSGYIDPLDITLLVIGQSSLFLRERAKYRHRLSASKLT